MEQSRNGSRSTYPDAGRRGARPLQPQGAVSRRRTYADGELDVFAAERYFKGTMDGDHRKDNQGVVAPLELAAAIANYARPRPETVAVAKPVGTRASAASSANSRTMLLRGRRDHRGNKCCVHVGALVRSCIGKRSVRVDTGAAKNSKEEAHASGDPAVASKIDWYKELRMQKAAHGVAGGDESNHGVAVVAAAAALPPNLNLGGREEKVAEFTSSSSSRRRSFTFVAPPAVNGNQDDDDDDDGAGSESSSDLFEIKSLIIDACPYEPSEASIKWSVATAPADASERGDRVSARCVTGRWSRDRPPTLLSGCVSYRAVEVSTAAGTMVPNAPRRR
jgi:hypothetical protein